MSMQSVGDRLIFPTTTGESLLPPECALIVLTSTLSNPATFLLHHFLQETIKSGTGNDEGIIYLSFLNGFDQLALGAKRLGVDLNSLRQQGQFVFIDGFSGLFSPEKHDGINTITLNTRVPFIMTLTQHLLKPLSAQKRKPILFIEGLDFLLASTSISPNDLLGLLSNLSSRSSRLFISLFADHSLLNSDTSLSKNHEILLKSLVHRAYNVISLRPLQTGTARDVTGVMRVTRGGGWYDFEVEGSGEEEWEMLYRVDEGRGKLFKYAT